MKSTEKWQDGIPIFIDLLLLSVGFIFSPAVQACYIILVTPETGSSPSDLDSAFASLGMQR